MDRRRQPLDRGPLVGELPQFSRGFDDWLLLERTRVAGVIAEMLRRIAAAAHIVSYDSYAAAVTAAGLVALDPLDAARNGYAPNVRQNPGDAILSLRAQQFTSSLAPRSDIPKGVRAVLLSAAGDRFTALAGSIPSWPRLTRPIRLADRESLALNGTLDIRQMAGFDLA